MVVEVRDTLRSATRRLVLQWTCGGVPGTVRMRFCCQLNAAYDPESTRHYQQKGISWNNAPSQVFDMFAEPAQIIHSRYRMARSGTETDHIRKNPVKY